MIQSYEIVIDLIGEGWTPRGASTAVKVWTAKRVVESLSAEDMVDIILGSDGKQIPNIKSLCDCEEFLSEAGLSNEEVIRSIES